MKLKKWRKCGWFNGWAKLWRKGRKEKSEWMSGCAMKGLKQRFERKDSGYDVINGA